MQSSFRYFYYGGLRGFLPLLLQQFLLEILPLFSGFSPIVSPGISVFFICFSPRCPRRISSTVLFRIHSEIFAYFHCDFLLRRSCFPGDSPRVFFLMFLPEFLVKYLQKFVLGFLLELVPVFLPEVLLSFLSDVISEFLLECLAWSFRKPLPIVFPVISPRGSCRIYSLYLFNTYFLLVFPGFFQKFLQ